MTEEMKAIIAGLKSARREVTDHYPACSLVWTRTLVHIADSLTRNDPLFFREAFIILVMQDDKDER